MALVLPSDVLAILREWANAAEPYPEDHPYMCTFDGVFTPEEQARIHSTYARMRLAKYGYSLEDDPHD